MKKVSPLLVRHEKPERNLKEALKNYKELRGSEAKQKGLEEALGNARTLTEARKIMRGESIKRSR